MRPRCICVPARVRLYAAQDLPSPHEFYRLHAPTIDAQKRSKQCSAATDKVCGKACRKECRKKCRAENAHALNFHCNDPGRGVPLVFRGLARKLASSFDRWGTRRQAPEPHAPN